MNWLSKMLIGTGLITCGIAGPALSATCTDQVQTYTIGAGDTLSRISQAVFGDASAWPLIYEYPGNAGRIGRNPNVLGIGERLQIPPCPGSIAALPTAEEIRQASTRPASTNSPKIDFPVPIYIAAHKNFAPFASPEWPQGGMATMIVRSALEAVGLGDRLRIHHVGDVHAQFRYLLPSKRHSLGIGWNMPDMDFWKTCDRLPKSMQPRCDYRASDPILTMAFNFFYEAGRADLQNATLEQIKQARLCRPGGWSAFQLEENGVPLTNLETPADMAACFKLLLAGEVDFVVASRLTALSQSTKMGILDKVEMANFAGVSFGFYLVAHKDNLDGAFEYLDAFNEGLKIIIDNGIYGKITSYYNDEFIRRLEGK